MVLNFLFQNYKFQLILIFDFYILSFLDFTCDIVIEICPWNKRE